MSSKTASATARQTSALLSLAKEAQGDPKDYRAANVDSASVLLDALRDARHDKLADHLNYLRRHYGNGARLLWWAREVASKTVSHLKALDLHAQLAAVDIDAVPIMSTDRGIGRTEQGRLARELLRRLKIKGVSVTKERGCMAVDVRFPARSDYSVYNEHGYVDLQSDPAALANRGAEDKIRRILLAAFPNHDDRSDSRSDYFNFCWSFRQDV